MVRRLIEKLRGKRQRPRGPLGGVRVAAVVDEFTRACLAPVVEISNLDATKWKREIARIDPHLLFVESAWRGANDSWRRRIASYEGHADSTLAELVSHCRAHAIPTVFWNKEDPVHFDRFIDRAALFDVVFTTAVERIDAYRARGKTAYALPFAASPELHHPANATWSDVVCFAGSYGEAGFPERRADLELLLDGAIGFDLRILDRNAHTARAHEGFPERFVRFVRDGVDYEELLALQRRYKVFLNVNSVRASKTMFSRRVFELLACGASVVSSPSAGVSELFGDVVAVVDSAEAARASIARFLDDDEHRLTVAARGIRRVHLAHTYEDRMRDVLAAVGCPTPPREHHALVTRVRSTAELERLAGLLETQEHPLDEKLIVTELPPDAVRSALASEVRVVHPSGEERATFREAAHRIASPRVVCLAIQHELGPAAIASLVACARFAGSDLVGHAPHAAHRTVPALHPHAIAMSRETLVRCGWSARDADLALLESVYRDLTKYAADSEGFAPRP